MKCSKSDIPWCDYGSSPVTGCYHPCRGKFCYAASMVKRWHGPGGDGIEPPAWDGLHVLYEPFRYQHERDADGHPSADPYPFGFHPTFHRYRLDVPAPRKPGRVFVVPMGDLWGEWVPPTWQDEVISACAQDARHDYLFLTKNPQAYRRIDWSDKPWAWLGATATGVAGVGGFHGAAAHLAVLRGKPTTFVSMEPWLGGDDGLDAIGAVVGSCSLAWLIIGPLTGAKARTAPPVSRDAVLRLRDACRREGVALYVKPSSTAWGMAPDEITGMQAFPRPHPNVATYRTADDFQALPFENAVPERSQASLL